MQRSEHAKDYIQLSLLKNGCESSNRDMLAYLNLQSRLTEYVWVDEKVASSFSTLSTEATIDVVDIMVSNSLEWLAFLMEAKEDIQFF